MLKCKRAMVINRFSIGGVYGSLEKLWSGPVGIFPAKWIHATHIAIVLHD